MQAVDGRQSHASKPIASACSTRLSRCGARFDFACRAVGWSRRWPWCRRVAVGFDARHTRRHRLATSLASHILIYIMMAGSLIREHREHLGISQRSLARRAGTTQAAVSRIERGLTSPNWETVSALMLA